MSREAAKVRQLQREAEARRKEREAVKQGKRPFYATKSEWL